MNMYESGEILNGLYLYSYPVNKSKKENTMKTSIAVANCKITVTCVNDTRTLITFPTPKIANHALAWCRKKEFGTLESVTALIERCKLVGAKRVGRCFPQKFGRLAGVYSYNIHPEHMIAK